MDREREEKERERKKERERRKSVRGERDEKNEQGEKLKIQRKEKKNANDSPSQSKMKASTESMSFLRSSTVARRTGLIFDFRKLKKNGEKERKENLAREKRLEEVEKKKKTRSLSTLLRLVCFSFFFVSRN